MLFCYVVPPTHLQFFNCVTDTSFYSMCADKMVSKQLVQSAPRSKKRWSYVTVTLKTKCKSTTPENSLASGGSFERNTFLVTVLDWLKKEKKKMIFGHFRFAPLK